MDQRDLQVQVHIFLKLVSWMDRLSKNGLGTFSFISQVIEYRKKKTHNAGVTARIWQHPWRTWISNVSGLNPSSDEYRSWDVTYDVHEATCSVLITLL